MSCITLQRVFGATVFSAALLVSGCASSLKDEYFVKAYDPTSGATNFFRVRIHGATTGSKTTLSAGFFDRAAVERLFGENMLAREHLGTDIKVFDEEGNHLDDLTASLAAAETAAHAAAVRELRRVAATLSERVAQMQTQLAVGGTDNPFLPRLNDASVAISEAETVLQAATVSEGELSVARNRLGTAMATVRAIRIAVDGDVIVRFLDGAGNEVDVSNQVQLIFVSTDAGRFTQALRDFVAAERTRQELMQVVLAPKIQEAERIRLDLEASNGTTSATLAQLAVVNEAMSGVTTQAQANALLLRAANESAGTVTIRDARDLRFHAEGL